MPKSKYDKNRVTIYLPNEILEEINKECERLDRNKSWLLRKAWEMSRQKFSNLPSIPKVDNDPK
jgi:uncharacterized small protein (TIGR04563 family)